MAGELRLEVMPALAAPSLLLAFEGWNDAGEAASSAGRFFADAVQGARLADLDPETFYDFTVNRPRVHQQPGGGRHIEWPSVEFRYGALCDGRGLVVGVGPEPHLRWRRFTEEVTGLARRCAIRRAVLLGAFLADVVYSRPVDVTGFASEAGRLAAIGVAPSRYEGPTGIVGVLGERLGASGLPVLSLWAGLPHYIGASPNPRGALALVQKLVSDLPLAIDEAPLRAEAAAFEQKVSALVSADPELSEYVRLLKKREFAQ